MPGTHKLIDYLCMNCEIVFRGRATASRKFCSPSCHDKFRTHPPTLKISKKKSKLPGSWYSRVKTDPQKMQYIRNRNKTYASSERGLSIKRAKEARRRAAKVNATPTWLSKLDRLKIKEIYISCPKGYEVDHIVPLQGKTVVGLHVPWNLQYLTQSENCKKHNKLDWEPQARL